MSEPSHSALAGFVPTVEPSRREGFRTTVPSADTRLEKLVGEPRAPWPTGPEGDEEQRLRAQIEGELNEQMNQQINDLQAHVEERLEAFAAAFEEDRERFRRQLSRAAAELALEVAERVVRRELSLDREAVLRVLEEAVKRTEGARHLHLRVHPDDAEFLSAKDELLTNLRVESVEGDPSVAAGGCLLEAGDRSWDATVEAQLAEIRERVEEILEGS